MKSYINTLMYSAGGLQPVRLRDDEVTQLEQQLQNSYIPPIQTQKEVPKNCFLFQKRLFGEYHFDLFFYPYYVHKSKI